MIRLIYNCRVIQKVKVVYFWDTSSQRLGLLDTDRETDALHGICCPLLSVRDRAYPQRRMNCTATWRTIHQRTCVVPAAAAVTMHYTSLPRQRARLSASSMHSVSFEQSNELPQTTRDC